MAGGDPPPQPTGHEFQEREHGFTVTIGLRLGMIDKQADTVEQSGKPTDGTDDVNCLDD